MTSRTRLATAGWIAFFALFPFGQGALGALFLAVDELYHLVRTKGESWRGMPLGKLLLSFVLVMVVSGLFSPRRDVALPLTLGYFLLFAGTFFAARRLARDRAFLDRTLLPAMIASASLASAYAIYQIASNWDSFAKGFYRAHVLAVGPNGFGTLILMFMPLGLAHFAGRTDRWRVLTLGFLALSLGALYATLSRGAWMGFAAMVIAYGASVRFSPAAGGSRRWTGWTALAALGVLPLVFIPALRDRLSTAFILERNTSRLFVWQAAVRMIVDHPWLGVGAGVFQHLYDSYALPGSPPYHMAYAHNLILNIWSEFGIVGLVPFTVLLGRLLVMAWKLAKGGDPLFRALFAALCGVLVHQMVDVPIYGVQVGGVFWALVGLVAAWSEQDNLRISEPTSAEVANQQSI